jgi:hypothetical protein
LILAIEVLAALDERRDLLKLASRNQLAQFLCEIFGLLRSNLRLGIKAKSDGVINFKGH